MSLLKGHPELVSVRYPPTTTSMDRNTRKSLERIIELLPDITSDEPADEIVKHIAAVQKWMSTSQGPINLIRDVIDRLEYIFDASEDQFSRDEIWDLIDEIKSEKVRRFA